jgi:hypothetical protein
VRIADDRNVGGVRRTTRRLVSYVAHEARRGVWDYRRAVFEDLINSPMARDPKRRRRLRRPTLAGAGAALGVIATLWATLVGQTIPALLRDEDAPIKRFRAQVAAICVRVDAEARRQSRSDVSAREAGVRLGYLVDGLAPGLASIRPPPLYEAEYSSFRAKLEAARKHFNAGDKADRMRDVLREGRRVDNELVAATDLAAIMQIAECEFAISEAGFDFRSALDDANSR